MTFYASLRSGVSLLNVRYKWQFGGTESEPFSTGISQPSSSFPLFRISIDKPALSEELLVYDLTDSTNWTTLPVK